MYRQKCLFPSIAGFRTRRLSVKLPSVLRDFPEDNPEQRIRLRICEECFRWKFRDKTESREQPGSLEIPDSLNNLPSASGKTLMTAGLHNMPCTAMIFNRHHRVKNRYRAVTVSQVNGNEVFSWGAWTRTSTGAMAGTESEEPKMNCGRWEWIRIPDWISALKRKQYFYTCYWFLTVIICTHLKK